MLTQKFPPTTPPKISAHPSSQATSATNVAYAFIHSDLSSESPKGHESGSAMHITSTPSIALPACTATFSWREFKVQFTCNYHTPTSSFSDFKLVKGSMNRALKSNTEGITLSMDCERIGGEVVRKRVEDGNGNLLLFVRIGCGYSGCGQIIADMVGKRVGEGRSVEEVELSGEERADVGLGAL